MTDDTRLIGCGFTYDDMPVGFRFRTMRRTITETDLVNFINLTWFTEDIFVNTHDTGDRALQGRVVPASLVYSFAEGLVMPSMQFTGIAFLGMELDVKKPTIVGDTIYARCEVIERRPASRGERGMVRTRNEIVNQRAEVVIAYTPLRIIKAAGSAPLQALRGSVTK